MTQTLVPVIFDLDGTLVDPAGGITDGIAAALTELGLPVPDKSRLDAMIGPKLGLSLMEIGVPVTLLDDAIRIYRSHYLSTGIAQGQLYPGVLDLLENFVGSGRPVAVATQKPEGLARIVLAHHGIAALFQSIRGSVQDENTKSVAEGKAGIVAAALSDLAAPSLSYSPRAIMVGDRAQDVAGAAANGLDCVGVGWGFALDGELHAAGAVGIVHTAQALHATITRLSECPGTTALNEVHTIGNV